MNSSENYHSLDEQTDTVFRQRSKLGFFTKLAATGALIINSLAGCFARDIAYIRGTEDIPSKVSSYRSNLEKIAEAKGFYDPATKQYDTAKVIAEAEKQLEKNPLSKSGYKNLHTYSVDELLAVKAALKKIIVEDDVLKRLEKDYDAALKRYHFLGAGDTDRSEEDRKRDYLVLGVMEYAANDFDTWREINKLRRNDLGRDLGNRDNYDWVAERYGNEVNGAHLIRGQRIKRNGKIAGGVTGGAVLAYLLVSLFSDDDNPAVNIGGEEGGIGGR